MIPKNIRKILISKKYFIFIFSPQLILQFTEGSNDFITEKTILFQGTRGGSTFFRGGGGSNFFQRGVQMLISIETHITCDFLGGWGSGQKASQTAKVVTACSTL